MLLKNCPRIAEHERRIAMLLQTRVFDVIGVIVLIASIAFSIYMEKG